MRPEALLVILAVLLTAPTLFAGDPIEPADVIAEALCGRPSDELTRAEALDAFELPAVPEIWQAATTDDLRKWLGTPRCQAATPNESVRFNSRRKTLKQIIARIEEAKIVAGVRRSLLVLARAEAPKNLWSRPNEWPASNECIGCDELRRAASAALGAAAAWRTATSAGTVIGARLGPSSSEETLISELCAARPSAVAAAEMTEDYRYYTWTEGGAWLLEVAAWFARPEVARTCGRR